MTPLQKATLEVLQDAAASGRSYVTCNHIVDGVKEKLGHAVMWNSIVGAFAKCRVWVGTTSGKMNTHAFYFLSREGADALKEETERREREHPMGAQMPGKFFVFVEEVQRIRRHTMIVRANTADEAEARARTECDEGRMPATMTITIERTYTVKPVREGHGA
jgi:hypothetical protein